MKHMRLALLALCALVANAQWLNYLAKGIPRLPDGKPNLLAPAPKQDLSGTWRVPPATLGPGGPPRYATYLAVDLPQDSVPLKPAARDVIRRRLADFGKDMPFSRCLPAGLPMANVYPAPYKIVQNPGLTIVLYEALGAYRQIFTDGRALPKDPNPAWFGYSIGRWEGDAFVVETAGFNGKAWIDGIGQPQGEKLRLTERFLRRDFGHIQLQMTIDDPEWYERPWSVTVGLELYPDTELLEDVCENQRDARRTAGK
jgi:hypothetical protein